MPSESTAVFISWISFHGRSEGLADALQIESRYFGGGSGNVLRRYARQWRSTTALLATMRPQTIIVMQPPVIALLAILSSRPGRRARLIGDLHTGTFEDPKWRWALPFVLRTLRRRGFAIVTNEDLAVRVRAAGCDVVVSHDLIDRVETVGAPFDDPRLASLSDSYVLVPLAYANDEPVEEILAAARQNPSLALVLTGRAPERFAEAAGGNVFFTGFVSRDDYQRLLSGASVVAALTTRNYTMQRAGYEALAAGKALVTSGTSTLVDYFGPAAVYAQPTSDGIAAALQDALSDVTARAAAMSELRELKLGEQSRLTSELRSRVLG